MKRLETWIDLRASCPATRRRAQTMSEHQHEMPTEASWQFMQDGVVFLNLNHQGGPRGGTELAPQNWWMGMAQRPAGRRHAALQPDAQPRSGDARQRRLPRALPGRRDARPPAARRSPASARLPDAGRGRLARAAAARLRADARRRAGRRAGARARSPSCIARRRSRTRRRRSGITPSTRRTSPWAC